MAHKVILPGCTTLERFVARLRNRVEDRLWKRLGRDITEEQRTRLEDLLTVPQGRSSWLDKLRSGPVRVSGPALVLAIRRLQTVRDLGIKLASYRRSARPSRVARALCWHRQGYRHQPVATGAPLGYWAVTINGTGYRNKETQPARSSSSAGFRSGRSSPLETRSSSENE